MDRKILDRHLKTLATLPESSAPFLTVTVDTENLGEARRTLLERARSIALSLPDEANALFHSAFGRVEGELERPISAQTRGLAIFVREGEHPFFAALRFEVPLATELACETFPAVYRLMELKDTYDRFVVLVSNEEEARIVEVSLGAVTRQLWAERPELRRRVGREWTRQHYQNHRRHRTEQFVKEKISILERLFASGGHSHLVIAGHPTMAARVRKQLPKHLADRVVDLVPASSQDRTRDIVAATIAAFVEKEERGSIAVAERLDQEIRRGGRLAVVGYRECVEALERGQADVLVISADYDRQFGDLTERNRLAWLANAAGCHVEVVEDPRALRRFGGVGCLLRYADHTDPSQQQVA